MTSAAADDGHDFVEWATAGRPLAGESRSGDRHFVAQQPSRMLLAVIDGLGHGPEAADAAEAAAAALAAGTEATLVSLLQRCHDSLGHTRGAVMTVASVDVGGRMEWLGVGNVEGIVVHADGAPGRHGIVLPGGVVGLTLPRLRPATVRLQRGDVLVLATDGIRSRFAECIDPGEPARKIAARVLAEYARDSDDALVLVARYTGPIS